MPITYYTEQEFNKEQQIKWSLEYAIKSISESIRAKFETNKRDNYYPYIPIYTNEITNALDYVRDLVDKQKLRRNSPIERNSFLDVGSGPGIVLSMARGFDFNKCVGVEFDTKLAELLSTGRINKDKKHNCDIYRLAGPKILNMDAFDFQEYGNYNVIYYYCPIKNENMQKTLEIKIEDECSVGCFIIPFLKKDKKILKDKRFKKHSFLKDHRETIIWEKIKR